MNFNAINKKIGEKLKTARKKAKLSQLELGVALRMSDKTISGYESGRITPSCAKIYEISKLLKTPIAYFFEDSEKDYSIKEKLDIVEKRLDEAKKELKEIKLYYKNLKSQR